MGRRRWVSVALAALRARGAPVPAECSGRKASSRFPRERRAGVWAETTCVAPVGARPCELLALVSAAHVDDTSLGAIAANRDAYARANGLASCVSTWHPSRSGSNLPGLYARYPIVAFALDAFAWAFWLDADSALLAVQPLPRLVRLHLGGTEVDAIVSGSSAGNCRIRGGVDRTPFLRECLGDADRKFDSVFEICFNNGHFFLRGGSAYAHSLLADTRARKGGLQYTLNLSV